jgi:hypothetical protein
VNLAGSHAYRFVLNATGYSGASDSSHLAWKSTYPEQQYSISGLEIKDLATYPLTLYPIVARFDQL